MKTILEKVLEALEHKDVFVRDAGGYEVKVGSDNEGLYIEYESEENIRAEEFVSAVVNKDGSVMVQRSNGEELYLTIMQTKLVDFKDKEDESNG